MNIIPFLFPAMLVATFIGFLFVIVALVNRFDRARRAKKLAADCRSLCY